MKSYLLHGEMVVRGFEPTLHFDPGFAPTGPVPMAAPSTTAGPHVTPAPPSLRVSSCFVDLPADAKVEDRVAATTGYLGGAFDVESVVENLLRRLAANQELVVDVYDVKNHSNPPVVYGSEVPLGAPSPS